MICGPVLSEEKDAVREIWYECFTTDNEYLDRFFYECYPFIKTFGLKEKENGEIASVMSIIDIFFGRFKGAYLYGVATRKKYRGNGYSAGLFNHFLENFSSQYDFILTRPAEESLFRLYETFGFDINLKRERHNIILNNIPVKPERIQPAEIKIENTVRIISRIAEENEIISFQDRHIVEYALNEISNNGYIFQDNDKFAILDMSDRSIVSNILLGPENTLYVKSPEMCFFRNRNYCLYICAAGKGAMTYGNTEKYALAQITEKGITKGLKSDMFPLMPLLME